MTDAMRDPYTIQSCFDVFMLAVCGLLYLWVWVSSKRLDLYANRVIELSDELSRLRTDLLDARTDLLDAYDELRDDMGV